MPALQLCQEIVSLIETIKDFDLELIEMLGELLLKDNGQIYDINYQVFMY
jgi:hypothetical protein